MTTIAPPPFIPENAPFSSAQRAWLNGFLAGLFSQGGVALPPNSTPAATVNLTVLYGTQTGTAASLSRGFVKDAKKLGFAAKAMDMAEFSADQLKDVTHLLIITSTYGDGEPPDNAKALHAELLSDAAPSLAHLEYAVLGLGDTNYEKFCACAIEFDERLLKLGARRIYERVDCDLDYEAAAQSWFEGVCAVLKGSQTLPQPVEIEPPTIRESPGYGRSHPFSAPLLENKVLNFPGSAKETRHLAFSLAGSDLRYEPGDALAVYATNCPELVDDLLRVTGFDGEEAVIGSNGKEKPLRLALLRDYDIGNLNRGALEKFSKFCRTPELERLLAPQHSAELTTYLHGRQWIDLVTQYPILDSRPADFVALLRKMQPRLYSIASSLTAHPNEVHLCVGIVRYETHGRRRKGVCSTYLAERIETDVPVFVHSNASFRLPVDASRDVIMIGPGTGIAPFRSFLQERTCSGDTGRNWLFFGDQRSASDFLYREEIESLQKNGSLHRLDLAFSRDQPEKIYVQHRMREQARELWRWLEGGAHLYVCGDASRMAKDVDAELQRIIQKEGAMTSEAAADYVVQLKTLKRYQRDIY